MSTDLTKRQVVWAILSWLKKEPVNEELDVVLQCLSEQYNVKVDDPDHKKQLDLSVNLEDVIRETSSKAAESDSSKDEKLVEFINILKQKGYFQGVEEGTPAYNERFERARQKFLQRHNSYEGLTADQLKVQGNQKMTGGNYKEAVACYTKAIELDGQNAIYYCNRAAAYTHLKEYKKAILDCEKSVAVDPSYSKAYSRLGTALFYDGNYSKAVENYSKAVELDPGNEGYQADLKAAEEKLKEMSSGGGVPGVGGFPGMGAPGASPFDFNNIASMFSNPEFMSMAQNIMKHPQFSDMVQNIAGSLGRGGAGGDPNAPGGVTPGMGAALPDLSQMFANLASQRPPDGTLPNTLNTPFGDIKREQLEAMQHMPEIRDNPKFQAIIEDVRASGPMAMLKYMSDPEVMNTMTKLASQLFAERYPQRR